MIEQVAFQKKLQEIFVEAQLKNSSYSLRAYARRIGMAPSALSEILNGKRRVSFKLVERTVAKLALSPQESYALLSLFPQKEKRAKSVIDRERLLQPLEFGDANSQYNKMNNSFHMTPQKLELSMDQFHMISEWYHFAILSLLETKDFISSDKWIAKRLRLKIPEVRNALTRLVRLKLLKYDSISNQYELTGLHYQTSDEVANIALRKAHATNLELAKDSLERDGLSERDFTSSTMAIDVTKIPEAKKLIRDFRRRLSQLLESGEKSEVYKISINLFPLSELHLSDDKDDDLEAHHSQDVIKNFDTVSLKNNNVEFDQFDFEHVDDDTADVDIDVDVDRCRLLFGGDHEERICSV